MIFSILAVVLFVVVVVLGLEDMKQQRREAERINRELERENVRRLNAEEALNFRIMLNREQLMREYTRWGVKEEETP